MSYSQNAETIESMEALLKHVAELNSKLRENGVLNGRGKQWLDANIPNWKSSVDGRVEVSDTRFGFPKVFPRFRQDPELFNRPQN